MPNFSFFKISVAFEWIQRQSDGRTRTVSSVIQDESVFFNSSAKIEKEVMKLRCIKGISIFHPYLS